MGYALRPLGYEYRLFSDQSASICRLGMRAILASMPEYVSSSITAPILVPAQRALPDVCQVQRATFVWFTRRANA